jgi:integrase
MTIYFRMQRQVKVAHPLMLRAIAVAKKKNDRMPTVQALLAHADLKPTSIYLHMSERHLKAAGTPLDKVELSSPDQVKRSRKLDKR